jgi:tripartite-type tricarboxylate transporter receptor subunit TctC
VNWWGIAGPAGIPFGTVEVLRGALVEIMADPTFRASLKDKGFDPDVLAGNDFARFVQTDLAAWKELAKKANITTEE